MRPRLRLFTGEDDDLIHEPTTLSITLGELIEVLEDAMSADRSWLMDFRADDVQIPEDLYEVLQEYKSFRTGA